MIKSKIQSINGFIKTRSAFVNFSFLYLVLIPLFTFYSQSTYAQYKVKTIVIDAGHGGKDPGAIGKKSQEKNITLAIALKVGEYIEQNLKGVNVIYTRKKDVFIELFKRAEVANKNKADVFISIHVNSNTNAKPYGTSTYVMGLHKSEDNLEVAKIENAVILKEDGYKENYNGFDPSSPESYIMLSLLQNAHLEQSLTLAAKVQDQFRDRAGRKDGGVKQAGLVVLWNATMPAILVETGFISNATEEKYLMTDEGQSIIASAIYRAFKEYKAEIEKTSVAYQSNTSSVTPNKEKKNENEVIFRVQIKSSVDKIKKGSVQVAGYPDIKEYNFKGVYKYYVGESNDFTEIIKVQTLVREKIPDAFIVAFKNDERITIKEAMKEIGRE